MPPSESVPLTITTLTSARPEDQLVGDDLRGRPQRPEQRVLGAGGPAAQHQPVHAQAAGAEQVEHADRQVLR